LDQAVQPARDALDAAVAAEADRRGAGTPPEAAVRLARELLSS
jgi:hypothetical protein